MTEDPATTNDRVGRVFADATRTMRVGPAPIAAIVQAGHRQRARRRALTAVCAVAALGLGGVGAVALIRSPVPHGPASSVASAPDGSGVSANSVADSSASMTTRDAARRLLEDKPGVPFMLPEQLPDGYIWRGPSGYATDGNMVTLRESMFGPGRDLGVVPVVIICTHGRGPDLCPEGVRHFDRVVDGYAVTISFSATRPAPEFEEFWRTVPLVNDLDVSWLR
ncbi:MAG: hypothetical protein ACRCYU_18885 [Nocardioides sp.]